MPAKPLYARQLSRPALSFDYTRKEEKSVDPQFGLRRFGPYDKHLRETKSTRGTILYPSALAKEARELDNALLNGFGPFAGFEKLLRSTMTIEHFEFANRNNRPDPMAYEEAVREFARSGTQFDIVYVILPDQVPYESRNAYTRTKSLLTSLSYPSQMIQTRTIRDREKFKWSISNIALATYAKLGGTPWVLDVKPEAGEVIIGVGKSEIWSDRIGEKRSLVGFTTLFQHNGAFVWVGTTPAVFSFDELGKALETATRDAILEYERKQGTKVNRVIFHSFKRIGPSEREGIRAAVDSINPEIRAALVHLNTTTTFRTFDTSNSLSIPPSGLDISFGEHQSVLVTDGLDDQGKRFRMGVPTPLLASLDTSSNPEFQGRFPHLVQQLFDLCHMNWRAFGATQQSVTVRYSELIADLLENLEEKETARLAAQTRLRERAWFL